MLIFGNFGKLPIGQILSDLDKFGYPVILSVLAFEMFTILVRYSVNLSISVSTSSGVVNDNWTGFSCLQATF